MHLYNNNLLERHIFLECVYYRDNYLSGDNSETRVYLGPPYSRQSFIGCGPYLGLRPLWLIVTLLASHWSIPNNGLCLWLFYLLHSYSALKTLSDVNKFYLGHNFMVVINLRRLYKLVPLCKEGFMEVRVINLNRKLVQTCGRLWPVLQFPTLWVGLYAYHFIYTPYYNHYILIYKYFYIKFCFFI